MPRIDIDEVLREKAPRFAKYIPRFIRNWLRRTIHEEALNDILAAGWNRPPQEFIHVAFERMRIAYRIDGLERLDPAERYLFVANHPFGGLDGMMIADALSRKHPATSMIRLNNSMIRTGESVLDNTCEAIWVGAPVVARIQENADAPAVISKSVPDSRPVLRRISSRLRKPMFR